VDAKGTNAAAAAATNHVCTFSFALKIDFLAFSAKPKD